MFHGLVTVQAIESFSCLSLYLQDLTCVRNLRLMRLQHREEFCGGLLLMYINSWRKDAKRMSPLSRAQRQVQMNWHTLKCKRSPLKTRKHIWFVVFFFFFLWEWLNTGICCQEGCRAAVLRVIQYMSKNVLDKWHLVALLVQCDRTRRLSEVPSSLNSSVILDLKERY